MGRGVKQACHLKPGATREINNLKRTILAASSLIVKQHRKLNNYLFFSLAPGALVYYDSELGCSIILNNGGFPQLTTNVCSFFPVLDTISCSCYEVNFFFPLCLLETMPYFIFTFCVQEVQKMIGNVFCSVCPPPTDSASVLGSCNPIHIKMERKFNVGNRNSWS